ncbi:hypothetical protein TRFO_27799 [Tritrichomonas foetus]|uniref:Uncharacterized protein n=1 Tax=Tritrichomonas foetus TaxID=1144522 RepID=A0A1J4K4P6_9EUKA|nr:hypothetical protein TRFO_27799 [Tritrichomonas foetus]|eukprot:OHT04654.1 hypothetical protein TRFO_27799 [Tritrichomonas foetus]
MSFEHFLESAQELKINDIFDVIFHSSYYPAFFIIHCFYVCYYLRISPGRNGLQWWRSLVLGFLLSYGPRYIFGSLISRGLPEHQSLMVYKIYLPVWLSMNICPFDLVYKFIHRLISRSVLAILAELGNGQLFIHYLWNSLNVFPDEPIKCLYIIMATYGTTMLVEYVDNLIFSPKRRFMFYPYHYLKRIFVLAAVTLALSHPSLVLKPDQIISMYVIIPYMATIFALLKLLDIVVERGHPFKMLDIVFPKVMLNFLFTYHAGKSEQA